MLIWICGIVDPVHWIADLVAVKMQQNLIFCKINLLLVVGVFSSVSLDY
jgi:hypothetical protein